MQFSSFITGVAHQLEAVDVIDIVAVPLVFYIGHRLHDVVLNYMEPERTLLRPLAPRARHF
jgi:hypothetical protein